MPSPLRKSKDPGYGGYKLLVWIIPKEPMARHETFQLHLYKYECFSRFNLKNLKHAMNNGNISPPAVFKDSKEIHKQLASSQEKRKDTFILTDYLFSKYLS